MRLYSHFIVTVTLYDAKIQRDPIGQGLRLSLTETFKVDFEWSGMKHQASMLAPECQTNIYFCVLNAKQMAASNQHLESSDQILATRCYKSFS